ncbi:MAG: DUF1214 domain-containing protein [Gammaproteobacteria bacterium]|nr:DUF1214 domain-containing protein [Gammaproteobacteria bacterium]
MNRYSFGDRTPGLIRDADGGLTIILSHKKPEEDGVNWLPAPEGRFWVIFRAYQPDQKIIDNVWQPPAWQVVN